MSDELDICWEGLLMYMNLIKWMEEAFEKVRVYPKIEWELDEK